MSVAARQVKIFAGESRSPSDFSCCADEVTGLFAQAAIAL